MTTLGAGSAPPTPGTSGGILGFGKAEVTKLADKIAANTGIKDRILAEAAAEVVADIYRNDRPGALSPNLEHAVKSAGVLLAKERDAKSRQAVHDAVENVFAHPVIGGIYQKFAQGKGGGYYPSIDDKEALLKELTTNPDTSISSIALEALAKIKQVRDENQPRRRVDGVRSAHVEDATQDDDLVSAEAIQGAFGEIMKDSVPSVGSLLDGGIGNIGSNIIAAAKKALFSLVASCAPVKDRVAAVGALVGQWVKGEVPFDTGAIGDQWDKVREDAQVTKMSRKLLANLKMVNEKGEVPDANVREITAEIQKRYVRIKAEKEKEAKALAGKPAEGAPDAPPKLLETHGFAELLKTVPESTVPDPARLSSPRPTPPGNPSLIPPQPALAVGK